MDMDTYLGEIKFENTINPLTGEANPRQIERVPAGTIFDFQLIYNISDIEQVTEDLQALADGIRLLTWIISAVMDRAAMAGLLFPSGMSRAFPGWLIRISSLLLLPLCSC